MTKWRIGLHFLLSYHKYTANDFDFSSFLSYMRSKETHLLPISKTTKREGRKSRARDIEFLANTRCPPAKVVFGTIKGYWGRKKSNYAKTL